MLRIDLFVEGEEIQSASVLGSIELPTSVSWLGFPNLLSGNRVVMLRRSGAEPHREEQLMISLCVCAHRSVRLTSKTHLACRD
jgi:hypothetical protein